MDRCRGFHSYSFSLLSGPSERSERAMRRQHVARQSNKGNSNRRSSRPSSNNNKLNRGLSNNSSSSKLNRDLSSSNRVNKGLNSNSRLNRGCSSNPGNRSSNKVDKGSSKALSNVSRLNRD